MSTFRWAVLACVLCTTSAASADIAPPPPLRFHLGRVAAIGADTNASEAEVERTIATVRATLRASLRDVERCARSVHGGYAWRAYDPQHARVRVRWDGSGVPSEVRVVSSDFASGVGACIESGIRAIRVIPPPTGRVVLMVFFDRD